MTQENELKHSTTNTAARELLASALDECGRPTDAAEVREGRNPFVRGEYALAAIEKSILAQSAAYEALASALRESMTYVESYAQASHMLDGFGPRKVNEHDELVARVRLLLVREGGDVRHAKSFTTGIANNALDD